MSYSDDPQDSPGIPGRGYTKGFHSGDAGNDGLPPVRQADPNANALPPADPGPGQPTQIVKTASSGAVPASSPAIALQSVLPASGASPAAPPAMQPVRQQSRAVPESRLVEPNPAPAPAPSGATAASTIAPGVEYQNNPVVGQDLLLNTHGLVKIYDGRTVVDGVNINVKKGEIVGLLGPNGAGKTTSFYMIVGLVPPNGGKVMFDDQDVTKLPMFKRARLGMGYLPQEESIFRKLTVEENIMAVMQTMNYSRKEKKARCEELLERFGITHIRKNIAMTCSGGEKRRVTIARSLVPNPSLIMLDEPFSGVDPIAVNEIQQIVQDLRSAGLAILITDHNARQTLELVDRAYLIYEGRVLREGTKDFLVNDPVSRELYLGDRFTM